MVAGKSYCNSLAKPNNTKDILPHISLSGLSHLEWKVAASIPLAGKVEAEATSEVGLGYVEVWLWEGCHSEVWHCQMTHPSYYFCYCCYYCCGLV